MVDEVKAIETETPLAEETKVEAPKEQTFNQAQLDNIIKSRLEAEHKKHQRTLDEVKKAEQDVLKEKEVKEAKSKSDLEKVMQQRIAEKDTEVLKYKNALKAEKIDNNLLSIVSQNQAINPSQVVSLLKDDIK